MTQRLIRQSVWGLLLSLLTVISVTAQVSNCQVLLEEALLAIEDNCGSAGRNEACYGYDQVNASFIDDVPEDFFTQPSDRSAIVALETIRTSALNLDTGAWGIALMNIQADLPDTLPGQNVTFMLMGDVEVENGVDPDSAFQPSEGLEITVTTPAGANIRSGAGLNFNVIGGTRSGETLLADGVSADGDWFRVAYNERIGWINRVVFDDTIQGLDELPVLTADLQTPMQSFYLRTGIGRPQCEEVPDDILLVQGPENIRVNITANGADIEIGSTLGLRIIEIEGEPFLEAIAFSGEINFMGIRLRPGQASRACLGEEDSRGQDGNSNDLVVTCDPTPAQAMDNFGAEWCVLEELPGNLLNYDINILCPGETPVPVSNPDNGGGVPASDSNVDGIDCSPLQLISPLSPVNSGNHTFSWEGAEGEGILYQLVFFNYDGIEVESFWTTDTSYNLNLGQQTSTGGTFSWQVRVYTDNGNTYVCASPGSPPLTRTGELDVLASGDGFTAYHSACAPNGFGTYSTTVTWNNAPSTPVVVTWEDGFAVPGSNSSDSTSGSTVISESSVTGGFNFINVSAGGETINLGGC